MQDSFCQSLKENLSTLKSLKAEFDLELDKSQKEYSREKLKEKKQSLRDALPEMKAEIKFYSLTKDIVVNEKKPVKYITNFLNLTNNLTESLLASEGEMRDFIKIMDSRGPAALKEKFSKTKEEYFDYYHYRFSLNKKLLVFIDSYLDKLMQNRWVIKRIPGEGGFYAIELRAERLKHYEYMLEATQEPYDKYSYNRLITAFLAKNADEFAKIAKEQMVWPLDYVPNALSEIIATF